MILEKQCYLPMEQIKGKLKIQGYDNFERIEIDINICQVFDWYDCNKTIHVIGSISNGNLFFTIPNGMDKGLYIIISIIIDNKTVYGRVNDNANAQTAFAITEHKDIDPLSVYHSIQEFRLNYVDQKKLFKQDENATPYSVLLFIKNLDLSVTADYGGIIVCPYNYLKLSNIIDYMNDAIKDVTNLNIATKSDSFDYSIPSAVFIMNNIMAHNHDEAEKYAITEAENLNSIFTTLLHSHGTIFSAITLGTKEKTFKTNILDIRYKGNLLHLAENSFNIRHYYEYIQKNNSYISVYMKLLRDAQNETDRLLRYYRFWIILEGLAMRHNYENNTMYDWSGNPIINKKKQPVTIGTEALNNVFELARKNFSEIYSSQEFVNGLPDIRTPKEFLSVCYQRRCCCTHSGICKPNDPFICKPGKNHMQLCKKCNIIDSNQPAGFQDAILRKLEDLAFQIVLNELNALAGPANSTSQVVDQFIL